MTQDRVYRKALSKKEAAKEIQKNAGSQFDPEVAELFLKLVEEEKLL
jgi:HD-GYP domain-containing protein (c-di-GMP phosphodiesterase class II)